MNDDEERGKKLCFAVSHATRRRRIERDEDISSAAALCGVFRSWQSPATTMKEIQEKKQERKNEEKKVAGEKCGVCSSMNIIVATRRNDSGRSERRERHTGLYNTHKNDIFMLPNCDSSTLRLCVLTPPTTTTTTSAQHILFRSSPGTTQRVSNDSEDEWYIKEISYKRRKKRQHKQHFESRNNTTSIYISHVVLRRSYHKSSCHTDSRLDFGRFGYIRIHYTYNHTFFTILFPSSPLRWWYFVRVGVGSPPLWVVSLSLVALPLSLFVVVIHTDDSFPRWKLYTQIFIKFSFGEWEFVSLVCRIEFFLFFGVFAFDDIDKVHIHVFDLC